MKEAGPLPDGVPRHRNPPVIGISKRIANGDEQTIGLYRDLYRVPQDILDRFINPMEIVRYFSEEYMRVMQKSGLSIDWRRRFITVDPHTAGSSSGSMDTCMRISTS